MNKRISILGCGWLGLALATDLIQKGYKVAGSTTSNDKLHTLEGKGIQPFIIDISNANADMSDFLMADVLIIAITSKNVEDFKTLISTIKESDVRQIIFISSTSVYPYTNSIVTEETRTAHTPLAAIEKLFIHDQALSTTVLRFGGLFGYDRQPGHFVRPNKHIDNPEGYVNLIHRDDCVEIIEQIISRNIRNEVLNACADTHPKRRDFYLKEAKKVGKCSIVFNEASANEYKIINSQKLKDLLRYEFKYSDLMHES